jgi:RNA polymerase sigma-70 factor, ECF subfamily
MEPRPRTTPSRELDDVTLARAQRGEGAAFAQLVKWHEGAIWSYLWRMLGPAAGRAQVEDLFQETFLGVHRALPRFSPTGPARLSTWIFGIATRVALHRRRTLHREVVANPAAEPSDGGSQAERLERMAMMPALLRALAELSPDHRAVFVLREFHDLDYDELARALHVDVGTVRSRLHRARAHLRGKLEEQR